MSPQPTPGGHQAAGEHDLVPASPAAVRPIPSAASPAALAERRLFEPIAGLLTRFDALPDTARLDALLHTQTPAPCSGGGQPVHFVHPEKEASTGYEEKVFHTGAVPTRADDWHDFFNALAWCVWPRAKAACNALHLREIAARKAAGLAGRGPWRDTLTQFDECGIVVVSAVAEIATLLAEHQWEAAFWTRRRELVASTRFLIFGHGSWDQLRQPFTGLCAKALYRVVDADWLSLSPAAQQAETDAWLAGFLLAAPTLSPRPLSPLPLLGIPGVSADSECRSYYQDTRQFRPKRRTAPG